MRVSQRSLRKEQNLWQNNVNSEVTGCDMNRHVELSVAAFYGL